MIDIDYFKKINDTYGHNAVDIILSKYAQCLKQNLRAEDIVGRYGDEKFLVILPGLDKDHAYAARERLLKIIAELNFKIDNLQVTMSGGVAQYHQGSALSLVETADKNLYTAKQQGRNQIIQ